MSKKNRNNQNKVVQMNGEKSLREIENEAIMLAQAKAERERVEAEAAIAEKRAKYPMRGLNGGDLFKILGILSRLNIKDDLVNMYKNNVRESIKYRKEALVNDHKSKADDIATKVREIERAGEIELAGVDIMGSLVEKILLNMNSIQSELNAFLGELLGKNADEVNELPFDDYIFILKEVIASDDFKTFFKSASSLVG